MDKSLDLPSHSVGDGDVMGRPLSRPRFAFQSAARTHVGLVRTLNEDSYVDRPNDGLWAVADGMGGHEAGEVASGALADALNRMTSSTAGYRFLEDVRATVMKVNQDLIAHAARLPQGAIIGSTVVAILAVDSHFACLWAGDSRAYRFRGGTLSRLSHDHSLVQDLIDSGDLSPEEAKTFPRSNVITRAVGVDKDLRIDSVEGAIEPDDVLLLCSDGLTGQVSDQEIAALLSEGSIDAAADALLDLTLARGARDNVTIVVVRAIDVRDRL